MDNGIFEKYCHIIDTMCGLGYILTGYNYTQGLLYNMIELEFSMMCYLGQPMLQSKTKSSFSCKDQEEFLKWVNFAKERINASNSPYSA